jgi:uncharacterized protein YkwD
MSGSKLATRFLTIVAFLALAAFSRVEAQQTPDSTSQTSGPDFRGEVEKETFFLVNQYRKNSELPLLVWDSEIAKVARAHSKDMATGEVDFGHEGFEDRVSRLKTVMNGFRGAGENVLMTSQLDQVAQRAVALWLRSPHHLKNIRGDFNYSGLGVWQDKDGTIYFTQIFMKFAPETEETQAAPPSSIITPFGMLAAPNTRARP